MKNEQLNFFVPAEIDIEKAGDNTGENRYKNMIVQGCASDESLDLDQQSMEPNGFDLSIFKAAGMLNYEHQAKKSPKNFIGEPIEAEIRNNKFFIKGKLWEKSPLARDLYDTVEIMKSSGSKRKLAWSIEGTPLAKDPRNPNRITKALITHVALTFMPKNANTWAEIVKGGTKSLFVVPEYEDDPQVEYLYKGIFGVNEYTLHKDFTITKAMCATGETGQQLIGENTSGAALKKESLDKDLKILTMPPETVQWASDNWENFQEDTKKALRKGLHSMIEKGGEGSKGGRIIGHTKLGKPIYARREDSNQEMKYDKEDHVDAAKAHEKESEKYKKMGSGGYDSYQYHAKEAIRHKEQSKKKMSVLERKDPSPIGMVNNHGGVSSNW
jgi:hypothetical protein